MKFLDSDKSRRGLTLIDVLIIIAAVAVLAVLLLPAITTTRNPAPRMTCVNNLKQLGLAFRTWSNEHADHFPWSVPQSNGGTLALAMSTQLWRHFETLSNEVSSPKIFVCPSDVERQNAGSWASRISNRNISYFIGLDADEAKPQSILSGDRNLSTNDNILTGVVSFPNPMAVHWTAAIHKGEGNFGLGDGSVMQVTARNLFHSVTNAGLPVRLSIP